MVMAKDEQFRIRPAGRHLLTIGRDLIKDECAAIIELVKNAYDAGSPDVHINFNVLNNKNILQIVISDTGHGMSRNDVVTKWLVPSTDDKLTRVKQKNRIMQGRKGIGRWSAAILGDDLFLETITEEGEKTEVYIQWDAFKNAEYLDQVPILVETNRTKDAHGTKLTINSSIAKLAFWINDRKGQNSKSGISNLEFELSKLVSPFAFSSKNKKDDFDIIVNYQNMFSEDSLNTEKKILPIPIVDAYDYCITGNIEKNGKGMVKFQTQKAKNSVPESKTIDLGRNTGCGTIAFDIRVYDRDPESIDALISRGKGLKHPDGTYFGKRDARNLLDSYNGLGVYRNDFRIRPLGDPEYDWLTLNKRRVQNPSMYVGSDQIIGYIQVQSEENSGLEEKSARDGLKENEAYESLKVIIIENILLELETRRFEYRQKEGIGRNKNKIDKQISEINIFGNLDKELKKVIKESNISNKAALAITTVVENNEKKQLEIIENIREAIAVYQGQATLGKIINVVLHEGRKPIGYYINTFPLMQKWLPKWKETKDANIYEKLAEAIDTSLINAKTLSGFYRQLDPLAAVQRGRKTFQKIKDSVTRAYQTFQGELDRNKITCKIEGANDASIECWPQDLQIIFTNLFENSLYWLINKSTTKNKEIKIVIEYEKGILEYIDFIDNGPGIEKRHIESEIIFEPGFSTKPQGTGLGLSIAGEAASRSKLALTARANDNGAYFRIEPISE
jgi:signal transduction histidine kinase